MNRSFPNRWSFSYLEFTKYVTNIIAEPQYKYGQQEQVTVRNHNRSTALERSVLKYWGTQTRFTGTQPRPQLLSWLKTYSCSVHLATFPAFLAFLSWGGGGGDKEYFKILQFYAANFEEVDGVYWFRFLRLSRAVDARI